ncbi:MAG: hypothetical protein WAM04_00090 [Candidatus Sulfotelmatobacter sp.]
MSPNLRLLAFSFPTKIKIHQTLAINKLKFSATFISLAFVSTMLLSLTCLAQQPTAPQPDSQSTNSVASANPAPAATTITVPAGVSIALVLMHPIQSRYVHRGDEIYAQTTSPVVAGNEVVIPPGTFVQGKVDKLSRTDGRAELYLQSISITYPDGYVAPVAGPITLESGDGYAFQDPGSGHIAGALALPAAGAGVGALIGHFTASSQPNTITSTLPPGCTGPPPGCLSSSVTAPGSTAKNTIIGSAVGAAIGGIAAFALLFHTHNFFLDVGSPVEMTLQHPLSLEQDQVATALKDAEQHPAPQQPISPRPQIAMPDNNDPGICWTPGTPGTPGIDIPGTPAVGGSPGTPPTHIPGIPPTPPTAHPCR